MPFHYVQRYAPTSALIAGGTQYIAAGGTLDFTAPTTIELDPSVFTAAGTYALFDYSAAGATFPGGQTDLNTYVTIDDNDLIGLSYQAGSLTDDTVAKTVKITLV